MAGVTKVRLATNRRNHRRALPGNSRRVPNVRRTGDDRTMCSGQTDEQKPKTRYYYIGYIDTRDGWEKFDRETPDATEAETGYEIVEGPFLTPSDQEDAYRDAI